MRRPLRRPAVILSGALLATTALVLPGSAQADPAPGLTSPAGAAATWAVAQLTDGTHASQDHGLTADLVIAFAATNVDSDASERATDWLAANAGDYVHRGGPDAVNAGGAAKLALVAGIQHRDGGDFGGHDLTGLLTDGLQDSGRFTDTGPTGDMSNQFTQSLAVLALDRFGEVPGHAVDFLAATRCADGGYPLSLRQDPDRCTSDTDSTGMAVQALLAVGRTADAEPALDWLTENQGVDGGFGYNSTSPPNSNSTALAVQALAAGGRTDAAEQGTTWLRSVQLDCSASPEDRGAVGYDEPVADGLALRATAQVIPALAGQALGEIDAASGGEPLPPFDCDGDGSSGGASGDNGDNGDGDNGDGGDGGDGGDDHGAGDHGGGDAGGDDGGDSDGGVAGDAGDTGGDAGVSGTTGGDPTTGGDTGGDAGTYGPNDGTTGGVTPDGGLAATGSTALPLLAGAAGLLVLGGAAYLFARQRRAGF